MKKQQYYLLSIIVAIILLLLIAINGYISNQDSISELESRIDTLEWELEK